MKTPNLTAVLFMSPNLTAALLIAPSTTTTSPRTSLSCPTTTPLLDQKAPLLGRSLSSTLTLHAGDPLLISPRTSYLLPTSALLGPAMTLLFAPSAHASVTLTAGGPAALINGLTYTLAPDGILIQVGGGQRVSVPGAAVVTTSIAGEGEFVVSTVPDEAGTAVGMEVGGGGAVGSGGEGRRRGLWWCWVALVVGLGWEFG